MLKPTLPKSQGTSCAYYAFLNARPKILLQGWGHDPEELAVDVAAPLSRLRRTDAIQVRVADLAVRTISPHLHQMFVRRYEGSEVDFGGALQLMCGRSVESQWGNCEQLSIVIDRSTTIK